MVPQSHPAGTIAANNLSPSNSHVVSLTETQKAEVEILRSDFEVMRAQVYALMNFEIQMVNFALVFLGVLIASLMQKSVLDVIAATPRVLIFSAGVFILLGLMHVYEKFRIFETVAYIDVFIGEPLYRLTGRRPLMQWEGYLGFCYRHEPLTSILAILRSALFLVPSFFLTASFFFYKKGLFDLYDMTSVFIFILLVATYLVAMRKLDRPLAYRLASSFTESTP